MKIIDIRIKIGIGVEDLPGKGANLHLQKTNSLSLNNHNSLIFGFFRPPLLNPKTRAEQTKTEALQSTNI